MVQVTVSDELAGGFNGSLVSPGDAAYDEVRAVHNGMVDKRPGLIARCHNVADVREPWTSGVTAGSRYRCGEVVTTWPAGRSPTAG